jgi:uncharacterized membrane protein YheB (UPF0754 family)
LLNPWGRSLAIELLSNKIFLSVMIVVIATAHGYGAAWLAIRMLFRPRRAVKFLGLTVWPQGMIPRHRERLAQSIGNAVGNELVSQETVVNALFETDFFRSKVESLVDSYTDDLLDKSYPSFIDALPKGARAPVLDALAAIQYRVAEHIADALRSEETADAVTTFVSRRVDEILARRLTDVVDEGTFEQVLGFVESRFRGIVNEKGFETKVRDFVGGRLDDLAHSHSPLAEMFTPETVGIIKERVDRQIPPIVQQLTDIATNTRTRTQIGALIKREVDDYYAQLSFFKKIFISRERIHNEVDDLVNKTLPRRVEELLSGEAFEQEAEAFLNSTIDHFFARPINELIGQIAQDKLLMIKDQVSERILALVRSSELSTTVSAYATDALERIRPHTLRALLEHANPDSAARLKNFLSKGLLTVLSREETAQTINNILSGQIERLLVTPIGRLGDSLPEQTIRDMSEALTDRITQAAREKLPQAILEFDIGGIVRRKVADYPADKLEALVLSVAQQHLKTIELFGALIGLVIGVFQAFYFWYFSGTAH